MSNYIIFLNDKKGVMALTVSPEEIKNKIRQLKEADYCTQIIDIAESADYENLSIKKGHVINNLNYIKTLVKDECLEVSEMYYDFEGENLTINLYYKGKEEAVNE